MTEDCGWFRHHWGIEVGYVVTDDLNVKPAWFPGVPDTWTGGSRPSEKVCGRCGKRKPLGWGFGL
jgi:hypothetical protein